MDDKAPPPSDPIETIRREIDGIDSTLLSLIAERLQIADKLTAAKAPQTGLPIRPGREVALLRRLVASAPAPLERELVVELWRALISGRWSVVEHFERDGKRYYLAHKNDPELAADRALTPRERQVFGYAELGHSDKLIAYSLGLSLSTVSTLLSSARRKLGASLELIRSSGEAADDSAERDDVES